MEIKLDKRHIIAMKSEGSVETPQYIVEEYNGCSVYQYIRYTFTRGISSRNELRVFEG